MTTGPGMAPVPLPLGFTASGINCGVRKYRPDLGLIISDRDAVGVGVFTTNECKAACVRRSRRLTPSANIRSIITNSGQANAVTGRDGDVRDRRMAEAVASGLGCEASQVLTASTGVIGVALEIEKIERGIPELISRASTSAQSFALAILTTDLIPKTVTTTLRLSQGEVRITGICKGSGMIHPNMATMLGYFLTDLSLTPEVARDLVKEAVEASFNMISVDGDTSTNDAVFLLANGASGVVAASDEDARLFKSTLIEMAQILAKAIARDGEGSTKLIEVELSGAPSKTVAKRAARGVTTSPLIKAAVHGEDPNWGRILAKLGAEGVPESCLERLSLKLQETPILEDGTPLVFDRDAVRVMLKVDTVKISIDLKSGAHTARAWGCDLSRKYVDINAEYST